MALQDLTPQLRTRLSRMERAVGWFVALAMLLLGFGFVYYVYNTAERKGWFLTKAPYYTYVKSASGLKVGDPVMLMGFDAGAITAITPMPGYQFTYNVYVQFELKAPNYGYMWTEGSRANVASADLLGKRVLEVTKGTGGYPTYIFNPLLEVAVATAPQLPDFTKWKMAQEVYNLHGTNLDLVAKPDDPLTNLNAITAAGYKNILVMDTREKRKLMTGIWNDQEGRYDFYTKETKPYWLLSDESAAITERLQELVGRVEVALPGILHLTNELANVLSNSASLTSNLNIIAVSARPAVSNLAVVTAQLNRPGALGEWLLPTNLQRQLEGTLGTANATMATANTNLTVLVENLARSLDNLASMTSNLNSQVQANTNMLSEISDAIVHADQFVQGLKHHWLFRSAFKKKAPSAPAPPPQPIPSPKGREER